MPTYTATFTVPAQVTIRVTVTRDNQQDGLAAAFDSLHAAHPSSATVLSLDLEGANLGDFSRTEPEQPPVELIEASQPAAPADLVTYTLTRLDSSGQVISQDAPAQYDVAKARFDAEAANPTCEPARFELRTPDHQVSVSSPAKRGGWEVFARCALGDEQELFTWQASKAAAYKLVATLVATGRYKALTLMDFTDRVKGPCHVATLE